MTTNGFRLYALDRGITLTSLPKDHLKSLRDEWKRADEAERACYKCAHDAVKEAKEYRANKAAFLKEQRQNCNGYLAFVTEYAATYRHKYRSYSDCIKAVPEK